MFLDEELEQIYARGGFTDETNKKLLVACVSRIPEYEPNCIPHVLTCLKQIDNAWKLFCKRHSEYNPDGFRRVILMSDKTGKFKKALNW